MSRITFKKRNGQAILYILIWISKSETFQTTRLQLALKISWIPPFVREGILYSLTISGPWFASIFFQNQNKYTDLFLLFFLYRKIIIGNKKKSYAYI